jgi:hypothetical protein
MTVPEPHRVLRLLLMFVSIIEAGAGIVLSLATNWVLALMSVPVVILNTGFVLALLKGIGIVALAFAYLLRAASRDPVRNIAVVDSLVFMLLAAALLNAYAIVSLHLGAFYPEPYLIARAVVQVILAVTFILLRPKHGAKHVKRRGFDEPISRLV